MPMAVPRPPRPRSVRGPGLVALALMSASALPLAAQAPGQNPVGEWRQMGADYGHTRYSALDQVDASNFQDLQVAWVWRGDNFGPSVDNIFRSTPSYVDGKLITVAGQRRTVVAIDPGTGETLWTYREPHTRRFDRSMRQNYGKGVAYAEIDGRGVVYISTPAFFLHAIDAETGRPLENWGRPVPVDGFPKTGVVDMMADLGVPYDPYEGHPVEHLVVTTSSPPVVANGVVIVGNSAEQGYYQTMKENIKGDVLGYDARTGAFLWKFNVIPRPGEFGHDTWTGPGQWEYTGDVSSWAPMAVDEELGLVYIPTNPPTNDFYGGHRLGDGLFGTSLIALDTRTGERRWHYQLVRHDIWNYDTSTAPVLMDVQINGQTVPIIAVATKQGWVYTFNRATGEPIWPIEDRPVPASRVPGEQAARTQPHPTWPEPFEMQGFPEDMVVDFTPELRARALEILSNYDWGPIFNPPLNTDNAEGLIASVHCPGSNGGANIPGPTSADPTTGILYVSTGRGCTAPRVTPCKELDPNSNMDYCTSGPSGIESIEGIPVHKPPYSSFVAYDMNTGEKLWTIPNGDTPERIRNHRLLQGVELPNTGQTSRGISMVTGSLLVTAEGLGGNPVLHAHDKRTGERLASAELPAPGGYGMMTYMHEGKQYIVVQIASGTHPGSLAALALP